MRVAYTSILVVLGLVSFATSKGIYDPVKSYVTVLNSKNFGSQIDNNRAKGISIVHYYKEGGKYKVIHLRNFYFISSFLRESNNNLIIYRWPLKDPSWRIRKLRKGKQRNVENGSC